jgi:hypothetical protein
MKIELWRTSKDRGHPYQKLSGELLPSCWTSSAYYLHYQPNLGLTSLVYILFALFYTKQETNDLIFDINRKIGVEARTGSNRLVRKIENKDLYS